MCEREGEAWNTWNNRIHLSLPLNHNHDDKSDTAAERAGGILPRNITAELLASMPSV